MNWSKVRMVPAALLLACASIVAPAAHSQDGFPSKPLRIIVPVPPGGNLDAVTRAVAERLSANIGQPVVVENRAGASSSVGSRFVAQSAPDGYTLLAMANTFLSTPAVMPSAGYDPVEEFVGVSMLVRVPNVLVVPATSPFKTLPDLISSAKARPGQVSFATAGAGSVGHMAAERFSSDLGLKMLHVPYKGNGPALIDMVGGRVDMMFDQVSTSGPHIRSGKLRALAVTSQARSPVLPEVPTMEEAGVKNFVDYTFNGLAAPAGVPRDIVARLHAEVRKALESPELRSRFASLGVEVAPSASHEEFTAYIRSETARYAKLAKEANIRVE